MSAPRPLPPEDDFFARVAVFNKFATSGQIDACVQVIIDEVIDGRPRPSLASVLIEKRFISTSAASAVQEAVRKYAAEQGGVIPPDGNADIPVIMKTHAPAGDSRISVAVKQPTEKPKDKRFRILIAEAENAGVLTISCPRLTTRDGPTLEAACRLLLKTGRPELRVDLRKVQTIASMVIGIMVKTSADAQAAGSTLVLYCEEATAKLTRMVFGGQLEVRSGEPLPPAPKKPPEAPELQPAATGSKPGAPASMLPEESLFGRVAIRNKLLTQEQLDECAVAIGARVAAGKPRSSLASVLIEMGYISAAAAAKVQEAVRKYAAERAGEQAPAPGMAAEPKPMRKHAPAGDSQIFVPIKPDKGPDDKRFNIVTSETSRRANMVVDCHSLGANDAPALEAACRRLIGTGERSLEIDLRYLDYLPTTIIETVGKMSSEAEKAGHHMLILCTKDVAKTFHLIVGKKVAIKIGGKPKGPSMQLRSV